MYSRWLILCSVSIAAMKDDHELLCSSRDWDCPVEQSSVRDGAVSIPGPFGIDFCFSTSTAPRGCSRLGVMHALYLYIFTVNQNQFGQSRKSKAARGVLKHVRNTNWEARKSTSSTQGHKKTRSTLGMRVVYKGQAGRTDQKASGETLSRADCMSALYPMIAFDDRTSTVGRS